MSSELPPRRRLPLGYRVKRKLARWTPWTMWSAALVVTVWLGVDLKGSGVAPAMAEVHEVTLTSPRVAPIVAVQVKAGDNVKKGQVLVQLETAGLDAQLAVARADLDRLKREVGAQGVALAADTHETSARLSVDAERAALRVAQIQGELSRDRSELAQMDEQIARQQKLVDQQLTTATVLDGLKLRRAALARKVKASGATLSAARSAAKAGAARANVTGGAQKDQASSPRDLRLAPHRAAVDAQVARVAQLEGQRARLSLAAPFSGRVGEVFQRPGDMARPGVPILKLVDDRPRGSSPMSTRCGPTESAWGTRCSCVPPTARARCAPGESPRPAPASASCRYDSARSPPTRRTAGGCTWRSTRPNPTM